MFSFDLGRWLKSWFRRKGKPVQKRPRLRLHLEELETRLAPALFVWTGKGGNADWTTAANWSTNIAPTVAASLSTPVSLEFETGATLYSSIDNLAGATSLQVQQLTIDAGTTYTISPNSAAAASNTLTFVPGGEILVNTNAVANVSIPITFGGAASSAENITVEAAATLTLSGALTSNNNELTQMTMQGAGTLVLADANTGLNSPWNIVDAGGNAIVQITDANALGNGAVTVNTNAQLQLNIPSGALDGATILNKLTLNGAGPGGTGALLDVNTGVSSPANTAPETIWAGTITMDSTNGTSNTTIGVSDLTGFVTAVSAGPAAQVVTTNSTAGLVNEDSVRIAGTGNIANVDGQWTIDNVSGTQFTLVGSEAGGPAAYVPTYPTWTAPYQLEITGTISDNNTLPYTLTKEGQGTLYLNPTNAAGNTYLGNTVINNGILQIGQPFALGPGGATTTVNTSSLESGSLALEYTGNPNIPTQYLNYAQNQIITITNAATTTSNLELGYNGAFANVPYNPSPAVMAGNIQTAFNAMSTLANLAVGATPAVTVVGSGTAADSVFTLTFNNSLSGLEIPAVSAVITAGVGTATVGVAQGAAVGFQVPDENLVLNGFGVQGGLEAPRSAATLDTGVVPQGEHVGALENAAGANSWNQTITLWSSVAELDASDQPISPPGAGSYTANGNDLEAVTIGAAANTNLTIDAPITDDGIGVNNIYSLTKVGLGRVILTEADPFTADVDVTAGTLNIRDSQALGVGLSSVAPITKTVWWGASLELQADNIPDSLDAVDGLGIYDLDLPADNVLDLAGAGWNPDPAVVGSIAEGALDNMTGVNKVEGNIKLITAGGTDTDIGVDPNPDPTNVQGETYNDLSQLTIDGVISDAGGGTAPSTTYLQKVGFGELVLTNANTYTGPGTGHPATLVDGSPIASTVTPQTEIAQGWITVENDQALGGTIATTDSLDPPVQVDAGAALMLKQDLNGDDLYLHYYNMVLSGEGVVQPEFFNADDVLAPLEPWLNQDGALENLDGANTIAGYITLNGPAGIGVELDGANIPNPPPSQLTLTALGTSGATIMDGAAAGELIKLGSQRLIIQDPGTYTGSSDPDFPSGPTGVNIMAGVLQIQNNTALGEGTNKATLTTIVQAGAALELAPSVAQLNGGISSGLDVQDDNLVLNGTGNTTLGDAPLTVLSNDNLWGGPITLNTALAVTFENALGDAALNDMTVTPAPSLLGTFPTITATATTPGSSGIDAVQSLTFGGTITGGSFTLTINDPDGVTATTAPIPILDPVTGVIDIPVLITSIQSALNLLAPVFGGTVAQGIAQVTTSTPGIDVLPNSRLSTTGTVSDGASNLNAADITVGGGGELVLAGQNTYTGTTYVNQGILTLENSQALGAGTVSEVQTVTITGPVGVNFNLSFTDGHGDVAATPLITYHGTAADAVTIQNDLDALSTIGGSGAGGSVNVTLAGNVFTITYGGSLSGFRLDSATNVPFLSSNGDVFATVATQTFGGGGTVVASGAQLQMEGGISVANEPLEMQGTGAPLEPEVQNVTVGSLVASGAVLAASTGSPILITTASTAALTTGETVTVTGVVDSVTGDTGAAADSTWTIDVLNGTQFSLVGSSAADAATANTGTWTAANQVGAFTLSFTNPNTGLTSSTTGLPVGANANQVQAALNGLQSIQQGAGNGGGSVVVNETASDVYTVLFEGAYALPAATNLPSIVATPTPEQVLTVSGTTGGYALRFTGFGTATNTLSPSLQASGGVGLFSSVENALDTILRTPGSPGYVGFTNLTGGFTAGSNSITVTTSTASLAVGMVVAGVGIPIGATVTAIDSATTITISQDATLTETSTTLGFFDCGTASVLATATGDSYVIEFGGTLAGQTVPLLIATSFQGNTDATVSASNGGTAFVTTQVQGGSANATPTQWFQVGPAPINEGAVSTGENANGVTTNPADVTGSIISVVTDENDPNIVYVATADGGVWKTVDADPAAPAADSTNTTWTPLFDGVSAVQKVQVLGSSGTFNLAFTNPAVTGDTNSSLFITDLASTGDISVGQSIAGAGIPAGTTVASIVSATTITISQAATATATGVVLTFGTFALPYDATANQVQAALNGLDSIGGAGGSVSVTAVPTAGVDAVQQLVLPQGITSNGTIAPNSMTINGLPPATTAMLQAGMSVTGAGIPAGTTIVSVGATSVTITLPATASGTVALTFGAAIAGSTTFTLSFGTPATTTTITFENNATDAADIADALNAATFAPIGGIGGSVTVTQTATGTFSISFGGALGQQPLPVADVLAATVTSGPVTTSPTSNATTLTPGALPSNTYTVAFSGGSFANQNVSALTYTSAGGATIAGGLPLVNVPVTGSSNTYTEPTVSFSTPPGGTPAVGAVNFTGDVPTYTVTNFGTGYNIGGALVNPAVTVTAAAGDVTGGGATAQVTTSWGVEGATPSGSPAGGFGGFPLVEAPGAPAPPAVWDAPPTITFSVSPLGAAYTTQGYTIWDPTTGEVTGIVITNPGAGYGPDGPTATLPVDLNLFAAAISGFTVGGPLGFGIATDMTGVVSKVAEFTVGSNYTLDPIVTIAPPSTAGGINATAIPNREGTITGVTILSSGSGYTAIAPPIATFSSAPGFANGSNAVASLTPVAATVQAGLGTNDVLFSGAIVQAPNPDPGTLYLGTGDGSNLADAYSGAGVYVTTDYGQTWNLLVDQDTGYNPLAGQAVDQLIVDPTGQYIFAATSDLAVDSYVAAESAMVSLGNATAGSDVIKGFISTTGLVPGMTVTGVGIPAGTTITGVNSTSIVLSQSATGTETADTLTFNALPTAGIWRYDTKTLTWTNITNDEFNGLGDQSIANSTVDPATFLADASWTSLYLATFGILYASLGTANGGTAGTDSDFIYMTENPTAATPVWSTQGSYNQPPPFNTWPFITQGTAYQALQTGSAAPVAYQPSIQYVMPAPYAFETDGNIKISGSGVAVFAAVANSTSAANAPEAGNLATYPSGGETILEQTISPIFSAINAWAPVTAPTSGAIASYLENQGGTVTAIVAASPTEFFLGGTQDATGEFFVVEYNAGVWTDISIDANNNGPESGINSMSIDKSGNLVVGTDGGVWRYNTTSSTWTDLNGNLAVSQIVGVATSPTDAGTILISATGVGVAQSAAGATQLGTQALPQSWTSVDDPTQGNVGPVYFDPNNPSIAYAFVDTQQPLQVGATTFLSNVITGLANTATISVGMPVIGPGVSLGTVVTGITGPNSITISTVANVTLANGAEVVYTVESNELQVGQLGATTKGSALVTDLASTAQFAIGMSVTGPGVPAGTTILAITSTTSITLSTNATATSSDGASVWAPVLINSGAFPYGFSAPGGVVGGSPTSSAGVAGTPYVVSALDVAPDTTQLEFWGEPALGGAAANLLQIDYNYVTGIATFNDLNPNETVVLTGNTTALNTVTGLASTAQLAVGDTVTGDGIPLGDTISAILGSTSVSLAAPATAGFAVTTLTFNGTFTPTQIALATDQGPFLADPDFPGVTDQGANNPDPNTIYLADNTAIIVSKNDGLNWSTTSRTPGPNNTVYPSGLPAPGLNPATIITGLYVNPTDRDNVFAIAGGGDVQGITGFVGTAGESRVFESFNAGLTWTDISAGLPDSPAWTILEDTRSGNLYLGNDLGVYELAGGVVTATNVWERFGAGMPYVAVHALNLNQSLNILTAGTYGLSVYQFFLDSATSNTGGLRAASGSDIWNGPIILTGATTIGAQGDANLQNGIAVADLQILGEISDIEGGQAQNTLTKIGAGNVVLGGANVYSGVTVVQQGNLVVENSDALGNAGATVGVQEVIVGNHPVAGTTQFSVTFDGAATAALTYTGTATDAVNIANALAGLSTIGGAGGTVAVAQVSPGVFTVTFGGTLAGTTLPISAAITAGAGTAFGSTAGVQELLLTGATAGVTKFQLSFKNTATPALTYTGTAADATNIQSFLNGIGAAVTVTQIGTGLFAVTFDRGIIGTQPQIEATVVQGTGAAYGSVIGGTVVTNGAILQLLTNLDNEPLFLYGNGVDRDGHYSGALENVSGDNTYTGVLTLVSNSTIGTDAGSALTIASPGTITDLGGGFGPFGFTKEGTGTLTIAAADSYQGNTFVNQGDLIVQNDLALGGHDAATTVLDGTQLQLQAPTEIGTATATTDTVTGINSIVGLSVGMAVSGPGIPAGTTLAAIGAGPAPYSITLSNPLAFSGNVTLVFGALDISTESLVLSGTGDPSDGGGALLNVNGDNSWGNRIFALTLASVQAFSPETAPTSTVPINVGSADISLPGNTTAGSATVSGLASTLEASTLQLAVGDEVSGSGIPLGDTVAAILSGGASVLLTSPATSTGSNVSLTFAAPYTLTIASPIIESHTSASSAVVLAGNTAIGSTTVGGLTSTSQLAVGDVVSGVGIPAGDTITAILDLHTIQLFSAATAGGSPTLTFSNSTMSSGLVKTGLGILILTQADTYTGSTYVDAGTLYVDNSTALGLYPGYAVQRVTTFDQGTSDTFTLSFTANGATAVVTPLEPNGVPAQTLQTDLNKGLNTLLGTSGLDDVQVNENVVYSGLDEVQTLTLNDPIAGTTAFTLSFAGQTTALSIPYTGTGATDALAIQNALDGLSTIGGVNVLGVAGAVTVSADPTDTVFTITFGGALQDAFQSLIGATVTSAAGTGGAQVAETDAGAGFPTYIYTIAFVGAAAQPALAGSQPLFVANSSSPLMTAVVGGVADGGFGTQVIAGASLQLDGDPEESGATLVVSPNATIALNGSGVGDNGALASFTGNDTWSGNVILQSSSTISAFPATQLTIAGQIADPSPAPVPPASIVPPDLTINQNTATSTGTVVLPGANTYAGNTFVDDGILNVQNTDSLGFNTSAVQALNINGTSGHFELFFPSPIPNTVNTGVITYPMTAAQLQTALNSSTMLGNPNAPGGGLGTATVTTEASGNTFVITFGGSLEGVNVPLLSAPSSFQVHVTAVTFSLLIGGESYTTVANGATLQVEGSLAANVLGKSLILNGNGFNGMGALDSSTGSNEWASAPIILGSTASIGAGNGATLNIAAPITDVYEVQTIAFTGFNAGDTYTLTVDGQTTGTLTYTGVTGTGQGSDGAAIQDALENPNGTTGLSPLLLVGGIATVSYLGGDEYQIAYAGNLTAATAPQVTAARNTGTGSIALSAPALEPLDFGVNKLGTGTVQYTSPTGNDYYGMTTVVAGTLQLDSAGTAIPQDLTVGVPTPINQVQTLTFTGVNQNDLFTLTYNGTTTGSITYFMNAAYEAAQIEAALDAVLGAGFVTVAPGAAPGSFLVTFVSLGGSNPAFTLSGLDLTTSSPISSATITTAGQAYAQPGTAGAPTAQVLASNQLADTSNVIVNNDGLFDLNGFSQTLNSLTIDSGIATTDWAGTTPGYLTLTNLVIDDGTLVTPSTGMVTVNGTITMTGGTINLLGTGSTLNFGTITASVSATSDASGSAIIEGAGIVELQNANQNFSVTAGAQTTDLLITANITNLTPGNGGINEISPGPNPGRLELAAQETIGGAVIEGGDLQVDALYEVGILTSVSTAPSPGYTFSLTYNNGLQTDSTGPITYTGDAGTFTNVYNALVTLLESLGFSTVQAMADVVVHAVLGLPANTFDAFDVTFLGKAAITELVPANNIALSGTSSSGVVSVHTAPGVNGVAFLSYAGGTPASLSGTGTVGTVDYLLTGTVGTVNPGSNGLTGAGVLQVGEMDFNPGGIFFVNPAHTSGNPTPIPGLDYDQLQSPYEINLDNTLLEGTPGPGTQIGDQFTIMQAPSITGNLDADINGVTAPIANGGTVFLNGQEFTVEYNYSSSPMTIVLTRVQAVLTSFTITSSLPSGSVYGQDVTFTATAVPENGASLATTPLYASASITAASWLAATNTVTVNAVNTFVPLQQVTITGMTPAAYNGTYTIISASPTGFTYGLTTDPGVASAFGAAAVQTNPIVTFTVDGTETVNVPVNPLTGTATFSPQELFGAWAPDTTYTIGATFTDAANVFQSDTATPITQTVAFNTVGVSERSTTSAPVQSTGTVIYGQTAQVSAIITPTVAPNIPDINAPGTIFASNPTGNVLFTSDASVPITNSYIPITYVAPNAGSLPLGTPDTATLTIQGSSLVPHGTHVIDASYVGTPSGYTGDANYLASTSIAFSLTVVPDQSVVTITVPTTPVLGQSASFDVTVTPNLVGSIGVPKGTLTFYVDSLSSPSVGSLPYTGGTVVFTTLADLLTQGAHTIYATFTDAATDGNYLNSTGNAAVNVGLATTKVTFGAVSPANPTYLQTVMLTATVSQAPAISGYPPPSGLISFYDGTPAPATLLGTGSVNTATGQASITTPATGAGALAVGTHTIYAVYSGDGTYATSFTTLNLTIAGATTTTTLTASPAGGVVFGTSATFTADVYSAVGVPTAGAGVLFYANGVLIAGQPANGEAITAGSEVISGVTTTVGVAVFSTAALPAGPDKITAVYTDDVDTNFATSTGTITSYPVTKAPTTVVFNGNTTPSNTTVYGQPVTFSVNVTAPTPSGPVNVGSVKFVDTTTGTTLGTGTISVVGGIGVATITTTALSATVHNITATYTDSTDNYFTGASTAATLSNFVVGQAGTSTVVTTSSVPTPGTAPTPASGTGETTPPVVFTATITTTASGSTVNPKTGNVVFLDNGSPFTNEPATGVALSGSNVATYTLKATDMTALVTHTITAVYTDTPADGNFITSTSPAIQQVVLENSTTTVNPSATTSYYGNAITVNPTVASNPLGGGTPTGSVTITDSVGNTTLYTGAFGSPISLGTLSVGTHTITVTYTGDGNFAPSSATTKITVNQATTSVRTPALSSSAPGNSEVGEPVTFTATLTVSSGGAPGPVNAGVLTFYNGATKLQLVYLNGVGNPATVTITNNPVGSNTLVVTLTTTTLALSAVGHDITAIYGGSTDFASSLVSNTVVQKVLAKGALGALATTQWTAGAAFSKTIAYTEGAAGGTGATFAAQSVTSPGLPANLAASVTGNNTITISGTPIAQGVYPFTLNVTDAAGTTVSRAYTLTINASPTLGVPAQGTYNTTYKSTITITGGTAPFTITDVPPGLAVSGAVKVGSSYLLSTKTITLTGKPTAEGTYNLALTDATGANTTTPVVINAAGTNIALNSSPKYWATGVPTSFTVAVTSPSGAVPIGTISYTVTGLLGYNSGTFGPYTLTAGKTTFSFTFPATADTYTVTVNYVPANANFAASSVAPQQNVGMQSLLSMSASPNPVTADQLVTFTAVLYGTGITETIANGGTVNFYANGALITGIVKAVPNPSGNSITYTISYRPVSTGTQSITVIYSGDSIFDPAMLATPYSLVVKAGRLN